MRNTLTSIALLAITTSTASAQLSPRFSPARVVSGDTLGVPGLFESVRALDVDDDGDLDLVGASTDFSTGFTAIRWYENPGRGAWPDQLSWTVFPTPLPGALNLGTGDIDSDGLDDVLATTADQAFLIRNLGGGAFAAAQVLPSGTLDFAEGVSVVDLDGDGDLDFVASVSTGVAWFENLGSGAFQPAQQMAGVPALNGLGVIRTGDMDGDGDVDILAAERLSPGAGDRAVWYENLGGGFFGPVQSPGSLCAGTPSSVCAADMDGDSDLDFVVADNRGIGSPYLGAIVWHENLGGGVFGTAQVIVSSTSSFPNYTNRDYMTVVADDLDGDGDLDILAHTGINGNILWHENLGGGSFSGERVLYEGAASFTRLRTADLDGDGDRDVYAESDQLEVQLSVYENLPVSPIGTTYCTPAVPNSTGTFGKIQATGSTLTGDNNVALVLVDMPSFVPVLFFTSQEQAVVTSVPNSQGTLCVGGSIGRYDGPGQIFLTRREGVMAYPIDISAIPTTTGSVQAMAGETWHFQAWYRDVNPTPTSNFTEAASIMFQ